ncbi:MAG: insulinase family protein, partial [Myxococcales bacterium]|nr:insulinase family protein [Myxococcales bacterium]
MHGLFHNDGFRSALLRAVSVLAFATPALANVDIQHWTAANGARVYFVESHVLPILDLQVDFDAGAARDPAGRSGLAGMTQGMLDAAAGGLD